MKRFAAFALTLVLCLGLFSGCGSEANYNVADVASAIEAVTTPPISPTMTSRWT